MLISVGKKLAHSGNIPIKEVWKLDMSKREKYKEFPSKFRDFSEQLF
jgi:hypothetical protein